MQGSASVLHFMPRRTSSSNHTGPVLEDQIKSLILQFFQVLLRFTEKVGQKSDSQSVLYCPSRASYSSLRNEANDALTKSWRALINVTRASFPGQTTSWQQFRSHVRGRRKMKARGGSGGESCLTLHFYFSFAFKCSLCFRRAVRREKGNIPEESQRSKSCTLLMRCAGVAFPGSNTFSLQRIIANCLPAFIKLSSLRHAYRGLRLTWQGKQRFATILPVDLWFFVECHFFTGLPTQEGFLLETFQKISILFLVTIK